MRQVLCERSIFSTGLTAGYLGFPGSLTGTPGLEVFNKAAWMVAGTFRNLYIEIDTAPGSGNSWTFEIYKNGVASGVTLTISDASTSGSDTSNSVSTTAGDYFSLRVTSTGTPASSGGMVYSCEFESTNTGESGYAQRFGAVGSAARTGVFWCTYQASGIEVWNSTNTADEIANIVPCDGTITGTALLVNTNPGGGSKAFSVAVYHAPAGSSTFTKQDGSGGTVDTRVAIVGSATDANGGFEFPVSAGDRVYYEIELVDTPDTFNRWLSVASRFRAAIDGESIMGGWTKTELTNGNDHYFPPHNVSDGGGSATEGTLTLVGNPSSFTLGRFYAHVRTAAGSGKDHTFTLRLNGATPASSLSITIADTDQDGSDLTGSYQVEGTTDALEMQYVPGNSPANTTVSWALTQTQLAEEIRGSLVAGEHTTVTASRAIAFGLDGNTNTHSEEGVFKVFGKQAITEYIELAESSAPSGVSNKGRIWVEDNGSGKSRLMIQFGSGAAQQIAIEP